MRVHLRTGLLAVLLILSVAALTPAIASAADCSTGNGSTTSWIGNGSPDPSSFTEADNWSNGAPSGACTAVISGASVHLEGGASFAALNLSNGASLSITGFTDSNGGAQQASLSTNATVASGAAIHLTSTSADLSNGTHPINPGAAILAGTVTNSGTITTDVGQAGANSYRDIRANVTNNATGTITMHTDMATCACGSGGTWINNGTMTTDAGTTSTFTRAGAGIVFSQPQSTGTFADNGHAVISGAFTNTAGTTTGHPIEIGGDLSAPSPAPASFEFDTVAGTIGGGNLTGDIGAQTTVLIHNNTAANSSVNVTVMADVTNHGTLTLDGGPGQDQLNGNGSHTLTNVGTLNLSADSSAPSTHISTVVISTGTINLAANSNADINAAFSQSAGTFTIGSGATFSSSNTVTLSGGTIANSGTFNGGTVTDTGGTETGNRIELCGGALTAPSTGPARFEIVDNAGCNGGSIADGSTVGASVDVLLRSFAAVNDLGNGSFTNDGTITVQSTTGHLVQLHGGTLTNNGTLNLTGSNIAVGLVNNGTTQVTADPALSTNFDGRYGPITQAAGSFTVAGGASVNIGNLTVTGGTLANGGSILASGDLVASGGHATGNPVTFSSNVTLSGSGTGTYDTTGVNLRSDVPAGYHLIADALLALRSGTTVNLGTIELRGGVGSNPNISGGTLDNQGTLSTAASSGSRAVSSVFQNEGTLDLGADLGFGNAFTSSGTIDVHGGATLSTPGFTQTAGITTLESHSDTLTSTAAAVITGGTLTGAGVITGDLVNHGTVMPAAALPSLTVGGAYTQGADGFLGTDIEAPATGTLHVTGAAALDGTLQVTTGASFAPAKGQTFTVLDAGAVSGTFATTAGLDSGPYDLAYGPAAVTLTARGRPVVTPPPSPGAGPPSIAVGDTTIANPQSGTTTAAFAVSLSGPSATTVTVHYATANGTAAAPDDYAAASGTLTFAPGQTTATVPVTVYGSGKPGASRTFFLDLSTPSGATLSTGRGTGTILGALSISDVSPASAGSGASTVLTVSGRGLSSGDHVTLTAPGKPTIAATAVLAPPDGRSVAATVDLHGAASGPRTVEVSSATGLGAQSLPAAFTVVTPTAPDIVATVGGPTLSRGGAGWFGHVYLENLGNTDAHNTVIRIDGLPTGAKVDVGGVSADPVVGDDGIEQQLTVVVPRISAGAFQALSLSFVPDTRNAHVPVASMRATVLANTDPSLDSRRPVTVAAGPAGVGPDHHFRGSVRLTSGGESTDVSYELWVGPPPPGGDGPLVTSHVSGGVQTDELIAPIYGQGCFVQGDPSADVLDWNCRNQGPAPSFAFGSAGTARAAGGVETATWLYEKVSSAAKKGKGSYDKFVATTAAIAQRNLRLRQALCLRKQNLVTADQLDQLNRLAEGSLVWVEVQAVREKLVDALDTAIAPVVNQGLDVLSNTIADKWEENIATTLWSNAEQNFLGGGGNQPVDSSTHDARMHWRRYLQQVAQVCPPGRKSNRIAPINVFAGDPNDMSGPLGPGRPHYLTGARVPYTYVASFENVPTASAPAATVTVTDRLDRSRLDPATVTLGPVTFGSQTISPPAGRQRFSSEVDLRPVSNQLVDVNGAVDRVTGVITWTFTTIDPATHQPVTDATGGFLPPDRTPPAGEGSVSFNADPTASGRRAGAGTANAATIVFDANAPITTPTWRNVVDRTRPHVRVIRVTSRVVRIGHRHVHTVTVRYSGRDQGSGVAGYDVYAARGRARLRRITVNTPTTTVRIVCRPGARYRFAVAARDRVGNVQARRVVSRPVRCR